MTTTTTIEFVTGYELGENVDAIARIHNLQKAVYVASAGLCVTDTAGVQAQAAAHTRTHGLSPAALHSPSLSF